MARIRLDKLLVKRNFAENIEEAENIIVAGKIMVDGAIQKSPSSAIDAGSAIEYVPEKSKYVSRGGFKLEKALESFAISVQGKRCLDIGASTGGFTDCLLQNGAKYVVAVDVGHGQIDLSLRNDSRVDVFEKLNAKDLKPSLIGGTCSLGVMDVSFTSVIPLIDSIVKCLDPIDLVILVKPQFECEQKEIDSRGIVTNVDSHFGAVLRVKNSLPSNLVMLDIIRSPIKGAKGNVEYLCHIGNAQQGIEPLSESRIKEIISSGDGQFKESE